MAVNPLSTNFLNLMSEEAISFKGKEAEDYTGASFSDIFSEALGTASEADTADKISALELLTGQTDDMSGLLLDATKAELSLQLAIQMKNKVVEAYNELMRTQV